MGRIERQVLSDQQMVATWLAAGAKDIPIPTLDAALGEFDAALASDPLPASPHLRLLRDLGVA